MSQTITPSSESEMGGIPDTRRLAGPVVPLVAYVAVDISVPLLLVWRTPIAWPGLLALVVGCVAVWIWTGLYRVRFTLSVLDDFPILLLGLAGGAGAVVVSGRAVTDGELPDVSDTLGLVAAVAVLARAMLYTVERRARTAGRRCVGRAVIIGDSPTGRELSAAMSAHPALGVVPVGRVSVPGSSEDERLRESATLGSIDELGRVVQLYGVSHFFVVGMVDEGRLTDVLQVAGDYGVQVYQTDRFRLAKWHRAAGSDQLWGIPVRDITPRRTDGAAYVLKRLFDFLAASAALVLLAPVMAVVACAVWFETRTVIYRQVRIGRNNREFVLYKFTSMLPVPEENSESLWSIAEDRRIGPVGRFIRRTSLDELPQLVNVIRGDMSVVGPRPERPEFAEHFAQTVPGYRYRLRVPVGLTGYAAVNGLRGDTSIHDRAVFDNVYIANWSLWLDAKIILQTVISVFRGRGA
ncbi:exopolysaccharide biosynthesis polyprenyl glycosylphosphotransferase [Prescottella defluvii]